MRSFVLDAYLVTIFDVFVFLLYCFFPNIFVYSLSGMVRNCSVHLYSGSLSISHDDSAFEIIRSVMNPLRIFLHAVTVPIVDPSAKSLFIDKIILDIACTSAGWVAFPFVQYEVTYPDIAAMSSALIFSGSCV